MPAALRRLHPRGRASRGIAVDADGAMLGRDCVPVRRVARHRSGAARREFINRFPNVMGDMKRRGTLIKIVRASSVRVEIAQRERILGVWPTVLRRSLSPPRLADFVLSW